MEKFFDEILNIKRIKYIYIAAIFAVIILGLVLDQWRDILFLSYQFGEFLNVIFILVAVFIASLLSLFLKKEKYKTWFISTNIFLTIFTFIILVAPSHDPSGFGPFSSSKENIAILSSLFYSFFVSLFFVKELVVCWWNKGK